MPRTRSLGWSELKIGLMTLAAIAIAAAVIFLLSGSGGFFWQRYALRAKFTNVAGLKTGAPVRVSGVEVGSVKNIAFNGVEVEVRFELSKEMQPHITDQSKAMICSAFKSVRRFGWSPLRGWTQMSERPPGLLA